MPRKTPRRINGSLALFPLGQVPRTGLDRYRVAIEVNCHFKEHSFLGGTLEPPVNLGLDLTENRLGEAVGVAAFEALGSPAVALSQPPQNPLAGLVATEKRKRVGLVLVGVGVVAFLFPDALKPLACDLPQVFVGVLVLDRLDGARVQKRKALFLATFTLLGRFTLAHCFSISLFLTTLPFVDMFPRFCR